MEELSAAVQDDAAMPSLGSVLNEAPSAGIYAGTNDDGVARRFAALELPKAWSLRRTSHHANLCASCRVGFGHKGTPAVVDEYLYFKCINCAEQQIANIREQEAWGGVCLPPALPEAPDGWRWEIFDAGGVHSHTGCLHSVEAGWALSQRTSNFEDAESCMCRPCGTAFSEVHLAVEKSKGVWRGASGRWKLIEAEPEESTKESEFEKRLAKLLGPVKLEGERGIVLRMGSEFEAALYDDLHPEGGAARAYVDSVFAEQTAAWKVWEQKRDAWRACECSARSEIGMHNGWGHDSWCPSKDQGL